MSLCFGGSTALDFFKLANMQDGESILVNGASGAVGAMAVQLAKQRGSEVTAVCSGRNVRTVEGLGADHVIDYTSEDWTQNGQRYDVVMDTFGNAPYKRIKGSLKPGGRMLMVAGDLPAMITPMQGDLHEDVLYCRSKHVPGAGAVLDDPVEVAWISVRQRAQPRD